MKPIILLFTLLIVSASSFAQDHYTGFVLDNRAGMSSTFIQPADIVDNRYKAYVGTSGNFSISNNFNALNFNNVIGFTKHPRFEYREQAKRGGYANINYSADIVHGMFEYKHKNAFGYHLSIKGFRINSGIPGDLSFADFNDFEDNPVINNPFAYKNLSMQSLIYMEHGFHYGRIIQENDENYFKAGITVKLINGLDADYFYSGEGQMSFSNTTGSGVEITNTGDPIEYGRIQPNTPSSDHKLGFGLDLGAVYEYRPNRAKYRYNMDGERNIMRYDVNKYVFKIGASLTNIGRVKFVKDTTKYDFDASATQIGGTSFLNLNGTGFNNVDAILLNPSTTQAMNDETEFKMALPTALNLQFDYHIFKNFYAGYAGSIPIGSRSNPNRVKHIGMHSIVPRYETKKIGITVPLSIKGNGQFMLGGSFRFSRKGTSFFVGAHNLTFLVGKRKMYDGNVFAGISIGIAHTVPEDRDFDEVSDAVDLCPDDPGPWKYKGCPDTDNDGIIDLKDHCIYDQGKPENYGCPDRDGDGVIDVNDHCPDDYGLAVHYGCPDRDQDGVIDAADRCPDVPGIELNNGCPFENQGCCSDNDGDGVSNEVDQCPEVSGSVYNNGCPIDSTNLNTIKFDEVKPDINPNHTGEQIKDNPLDPKEDNGGFDPVEISHDTNLDTLMNGEEIRKLTVYFDSDQSFMQQTYIKQINELLAELKAESNEDIHFVIIGHTDQDGNDDYNLVLSRKRSETVRKHIQNQGIDFDRVKTYYYGEFKPLTSDENERAKKLNRRVEIIVVKK